MSGNVTQRLLDVLGKCGVIAIGLIVFSVVFYVMTVAPARERLAAAQARAAVLHAQLPKSSTLRAEAENPLARIDAYYRSFPRVGELTVSIAHTLEAAKKHALVIDKADYRYEPVRKDELMAYQMSFTLKGSYPRVRGFLMALLRDNSALSLDDVSFRRDGIASAEIEARVRLTFYVTGVPWRHAAAG